MSEISKLPTGWAMARFEELLLISQNGCSQRQGSDGVPTVVLRLADLSLDGMVTTQEQRYVPLLSTQIEKYILLPGDLLAFRVNGSKAIAGQVAYYQGSEGFTFCDHFIRFRLKSGLAEPKFIALGFKVPQIRAQVEQGMVSSAGQNTVSQSTYANVRIPLPPLNEQRRIVAKIEALKARSQRVKEELEAIPALLDQFRQSVLAAAFRGDLTADWREKNPDVEPASVLLERIRAERRRRWEEVELEKMKAQGKTPKDDKWKEKYEEPESVDDNNLPSLPDNWCWVKWERIGFCQNGRAFPSKEYQTDGIKLLRPGNLHMSGRIEWTESNTRFMDGEWAEKYPDFIIGSNELVINLTAQSLADEFLGRICLTSEGEKCLLNQRIARLTPTIISPRFFLWLFKSCLFRRYVDGLNTGSLIQHMFTSQINEFVFPLPPLDEQEAIINLVEAKMKSIEEICHTVEDGLNAVPELERSILAKAFRGELVPQDPNDEPASVLLERIRAEREKLDTKKKAKGKTEKKSRKAKAEAAEPEQLSLPGFE